ncbi:uncharacterized protein L969DRAFT_49595 [Mixia osmundae IAM 14324]|uniref:Putative peroxiredoxin n=1 Tax=Mixia osmundae (strain CBS 9802 / IAM 14324 / JCM 22182 / KY 12970) TaxID=764103 RepID=G7E8E3_MIXOS|nr:uncharacterized protein L969DRAFT_49595 [Mixia osmundae IAM 14324]KEI39206.1 hypothetical protein L969DRAFT_49595 [Mixia osmundae IAM 14324]GAA99103.1 hypothetical protein E5Q_05792 [Mixia osmundae IAM 14324]
MSQEFPCRGSCCSVAPNLPLLPHPRTHIHIMAISKGDTIPSGEFAYVPYTGTDDPKVCGNPSKLSTSSWKGKKVVLFGVPGAFTKGCSERHLPAFVSGASELKGKGVDTIACLATNDMFVQSAWGSVHQVGDNVLMLSDSGLTWLKEAGLTVDLSAVGFGVRSARFAMIIDDLKVAYIGVEDSPSDVNVSSKEAVLAHL